MIIICQQCNVKFETDKKRPAAFCPVCKKKRLTEQKQKWQLQKRNNQNSMHKQKHVFTKMCSRCEHEFETSISQQIYCPTCKKERELELMREYRERLKSTIKETVDTKCKQCGKDFKVSPSSKAQFCPECLKERKRINCRLQFFNDSTLYTTKCQRCGREVSSKGRAKYCPECAIFVRAEQGRQRKQQQYHEKINMIKDRLELIKERWAVLQEQKTIHKIAMGE